MAAVQVICYFTALFIFFAVLALPELIAAVFGFNECTLAQLI